MLVLLVDAWCCCRCKDRVYSLWSPSGYVQHARIRYYLVLHTVLDQRYQVLCDLLFTCSAAINSGCLLRALFNVLTVAKRLPGTTSVNTTAYYEVYPVHYKAGYWTQSTTTVEDVVLCGDIYEYTAKRSTTFVHNSGVACIVCGVQQ